MDWTTRVHRMRDEALSIGDSVTADVCDRALTGDEAAIDECDGMLYREREDDVT